MSNEQLPVWQTLKFWIAVLAVIALVALGQTEMAKQLFASEIAEQVETHEAKVEPKAESTEEGNTSSTGD